MECLCDKNFTCSVCQDEKMNNSNKMYYWKIKCKSGLLWFKHDTLLDVNMIEKSLLADEILRLDWPEDEILSIKRTTAKAIGAFNLKAFTYTINREIALGA